MIDALEAQLATLDDRTLDTPEHIVRRAAAIDSIQTDIIDELDGLRFTAPSHRVRALRQAAERTHQRLLSIDATLAHDLRLRLLNEGRVAVREFIDRCIPDPGAPEGQAVIGYDWLDRLLLGILNDSDTAPDPQLEPEPEMVLNQRTPARILLELSRRAGLQPQDRVYDIGAGTGQTAAIIHMLSGAAVTGIEVEPAFCAYARAQAEALGLSGVTFVTADARTADYHDGALFYLYTPFEGAMLQTVLGRLRDRARHGPIRLATYGPCTRAVAQQRWLSAPIPADPGNFRLAMFDSRV